MAKYTSHGYHIPGSGEPGYMKPPDKARCGGIRLCVICRGEMGQYYLENPTTEMKSVEFTPAAVHQIPPAPLSDEALRLECLKLGVQLKARFTSLNRDEETVEFAKYFFDYVRPST